MKYHIFELQEKDHHSYECNLCGCKKFKFYGIQTHNLCNTGAAVLYQPSQLGAGQFGSFWINL